MPFALTCTCGARLEIDDKFAGQTIACPDCQQPLQTAPAGFDRQQTSGLALASIIMALTLAFTVVGTIAAVMLGALALLQISRDPQKLAGRGYAIAGIAIGIPMTAVTLLAVIFAGSSIELFGLTGMVGNAYWAGKLDHGGPLEVERPREGFAIKRPSSKWGVNKPASFFNEHVWEEVLLVVPEEDMVVLCYAERLGNPAQSIDSCRDKAVQDFKRTVKAGLFHDTSSKANRNASVTEKASKRSPAKDRLSMIEVQIDKRLASEDKSFLLRVYKMDGDDQMFVVIGGVRRSQFARLEPQLREAMDGFRILPHNDRFKW
jgi:hypothetical protein